MKIRLITFIITTILLSVMINYSFCYADNNTSKQNKKESENYIMYKYGDDNLFIEEGLSKNIFIDNTIISAHIVLTDYPMARMLVCFPCENSGVAFIFDPTDENTKDLKLKFPWGPTTFKKDKRRGVSFKVESNKKKLVISGIYLDSIRFIRALRYPGGVTERLNDKKEFLKLTGKPSRGYLFPKVSPLKEKDVSWLNFHRKTLDGKNNYYCSLSVFSRDVEIKEEYGKAILISKSGKPISFYGAASIDFDRMHSYFPRHLLNDRLNKYREDLITSDIEKFYRFDKKLKSLAFLSYHEKFLAGSWRFLTYFGRDTMMSLMMLRDSVRVKVYESAMQSVLDRVSREGIVAHEEDIGSQAIAHHIKSYIKLKKQGKEREAEEVSNNLSKPVYDYKMVDDDFMLPLMMELYVNDDAIPTESKLNFLNKVNARNEKNIVTLMRNFDYIIGKSSKYSDTENPMDMIKINEGFNAGDWRDSDAGLGWGKYPGSINVDFVANSLKAAKSILNSGLYSENDLMREVKHGRFDNLGEVLMNHEILDTSIKKWEQAKKHYKIELTPQQMKEKLKDYIENAPLKKEEKGYILSTKIENGITVKEFVYGDKTPDILKDGIVFYAVSLDKDGKPVEVMNSDSGFRLFNGNPDPEEIKHILKTINLPYPVGLAQKGGILTASPVYASDKSLWKTLDQNAYHGRVVWSWQMSLMEKGLCKQIKRFLKDPGKKELVKDMFSSLKNLRKMEEFSGELVNSELWTFKVENGKLIPIAYGVEKSSETESNPVQLWSTVGISTMFDFDEIQELINE